MPQPRGKTLEQEERRRKVAALWLAHLPQTEIAEQLKISQPTVSRDIEAIKQQYRAERTEILDREAAELDQMERDAAVQFAATKDREWISERRAIKERRARMLGLDAPQKVDSRAEVVSTVKVNWDDGPPDDTTPEESIPEG